MIECLNAIEDTSPTWKGYNLAPLMVFVAASLWSLDGVFRTYLSVRMNAEASVCWDHILTIGILIPCVHHFMFKNRKNLGPRILISLFFLGVGADAVANTLVTKGYSLGHVALVALLQQSQPVFGLLVTCMTLHEDVHLRVAVPLSMISFIGLLLMMWPYARESGHEHSAGAWDGLKAGAYGLAAAIIWASETVLSRYLLHHYTPCFSSVELLTYRQLIALISLFVYVYVLCASPMCDILGLECIRNATPNINQLCVIVLVAIIELVSHLLYYIGLNATPASVAVIMEMANPLWMLTLIPYILKWFDPQYDLTPLESEQTLGAIILICSTATLGVYSSKMTPSHPITVEELNEI